MGYDVESQFAVILEGVGNKITTKLSTNIDWFLGLVGYDIGLI
jgi:hypothetical protein